jgi:hypothetical protein
MQELDKVIVDMEYVGREAKIKEHLLHLLRRAIGPIESNRIEFGYIGEHTTADEIARQTLHKKRQADKAISFEMMLGEFQPIKKIGDHLAVRKLSSRPD